MRLPARAPRRGAASVEAAVSMLIIVPTFLYALFLDDLLRYAGDLQETVVSTPWDFTTQDYTRPDDLGLGHYPAYAPAGGAQVVQRNARLMFCDHESSGDSYNRGLDCKEETHHKGKALSGHVCWLTPGAHQITCDAAKKDVGDLANSRSGVVTDRTFATYKQSFGNNGGLYACHALSAVENYLLPKSFLPEFSKEPLAKKNWLRAGDSIHGNARKGDRETAYYFTEQRFALVTDPWALNERVIDKKKASVAVSPGTKSGPLHDRVEHVYKTTLLYSPMLGSTADLLQKTLSQKLLLFSPVATEVVSPNVSLSEGELPQPIQKIKQDKDKHAYFSTPWRDGASNAYERTAQARGRYYMGCQRQEGC